MMSDVSRSRIMDLLRAIRTDIDEVKANLIEIKERAGLLEARYVSVSFGCDRIAGDVVQIERHLIIATSSAN